MFTGLNRARGARRRARNETEEIRNEDGGQRVTGGCAAAGDGVRGRRKNFLNSRQNAKSSPRPCIRSDGRRGWNGGCGREMKRGSTVRVAAGSGH